MSHSESCSCSAAPPVRDGTDVERVIAAAVALFSTRPTDVVTVKWVAMQAGLPAEAVESRWSRDELLVLALDDLARRVEDAAGGDPACHGELLSSYVRLVAQALLNGIVPAALGATSPEIDRRVAAALATADLDDRSARLQACQRCALAWGWQLFKPHLLMAAGLDGLPADEIDAEVRSLEQAWGVSSP